MTELSGKFDYSALTRELKNEGISNMHMSSALKKVAQDNNIDDIKSLDGTKEIKIAQSIFDNYMAQGINSSVDMVNAEVNSPFPPFANPEMFAAGKIMGDGDSVLTPPETYSDDEWEVADYDDYYGFQANETEENNNNGDNSKENKEESLDFEGFKEKYAKSFMQDVMADKNTQNEMLKDIFAKADINSDDLLDQNELAAAFHAPELNQKKDFSGIEMMPQEGQDPLEGAMEMDMSGDSFNPQG